MTSKRPEGHTRGEVTLLVGGYGRQNSKVAPVAFAPGVTVMTMFLVTAKATL